MNSRPGVSAYDISIAPGLIDDLNRRLRASRLADIWPYQEWEQGTPSNYLRDFVNDWAEDDWSASQMELNRLPNFIALVDGIRIHFLWFRSPHTHAVPLVMAHGWPSSCLEFVEAAQRLADPGAFGLATDIAFDVVLPSLPGYLFSEPGPPGTSRSQETARLWDGLMSALGYDRYVAHGDDLGGGVALRLGTDFPERVSAIHLGPYGAAGAVHLLAPDHPLAKVFNRDERRWSETEGAYEHEHGTRPLTLAHALSDSPAGMAAWILEKWRAWSDCGGNLEAVVRRADLIRLLTLYWCTDTQVMGLLPYWERTHLESSVPERLVVPTGVFVTREEGVVMPSRELVEAAVPLTSWVEVVAGGHFLSQEQPAVAAELVRAFGMRCRDEFPQRFAHRPGR
jgi:pimeloyl-ACP methyl ester carboxylesterase